MDRVLLIIDDIQYAGHLEATLRKVGFDIETITNEYNMPEKLMTFNPDYIVVKGSGARVSTDNVGRKLKEMTKFLGKVILVFPAIHQSTSDDLIRLRMDALLFEPITALRLVTSLLSLTSLDKDTIFDKLVRLAQTDTPFREAEAEILKGTGVTIDKEIMLISGREKESGAAGSPLKDADILDFIQPEGAVASIDALLDDGDGWEAVSPHYLQELQTEISDFRKDLGLRIESYNQTIKTIDQDLKSGHNKRQTRAQNMKLFKTFAPDEVVKQDEERKKFVRSLVKK